MDYVSVYQIHIYIISDITAVVLDLKQLRSQI